MNRQAYDHQTAESLGRWFIRKARKQQAEQGTYQAARNLKKQGVPLDFALDILVPLGKPQPTAWRFVTAPLGRAA